MPDPPARRAVFLDRDGTLNEEGPYAHRTEDFVWIAGTPEAVRRLNEAGLLVLVITNQAGVAHGYFTEEDVQRFHAHIQAALKPYDAWIDAFYYCPYHPEAAVEVYRRVSNYRKPGTGMYEEALAAWHVEAKRSFAVGDKNSDIEPARTLGMTTLLVETGYGAEMKKTTQATHVVSDLSAAVDVILEAL